MGFVSIVVDAVVVLFSLTIALAAPLIGAQSILPGSLYPAPLQDLKRWYVAAFDDYLMAQPPAFLLGVFWLELTFLWPLSVANIYGVLAGRRWASTTCLMAGVCALTSMAAILGEMSGSGRATPRLLQLYIPYAEFGVIAILRGLWLCSRSAPSTATPSPASSARKKRV